MNNLNKDEQTNESSNSNINQSQDYIRKTITLEAKSKIIENPILRNNEKKLSTKINETLLTKINETFLPPKKGKNENKSSMALVKNRLLYEKMKMLRANVVGKGVTITNPSEKINEEREILKIIKEIDINADICLKKQKIYSEKYKKKYEQQKEILEQFKKRERIRLHQKKLNDKFIKLKEKIIQKSNKIYFLPNRKINFRNDCLNKECQSYLVNNKKEREQQDNFKDYIHSVNKSEESEEVNE